MHPGWWADNPRWAEPATLGGPPTAMPASTGRTEAQSAEGGRAERRLKTISRSDGWRGGGRVPRGPGAATHLPAGQAARGLGRVERHPARPDFYRLPIQLL